jgi:hypothetical protein
MGIDTGAGHFTKIHAQIETRWMKFILYNIDGVL